MHLYIKALVYVVDSLYRGESRRCFQNRDDRERHLPICRSIPRSADSARRLQYQIYTHVCKILKTVYRAVSLCVFQSVSNGSNMCNPKSFGKLVPGACMRLRRIHSNWFQEVGIMRFPWFLYASRCWCVDRRGRCTPSSCTFKHGANRRLHRRACVSHAIP